MNKRGDYSKWNEARKVLGDDFWDVISDVLPNIGPRMDVVKTDQALNIVMELPGLVNPGDVNLRLKGSHLLVEGTIAKPYTVSEDAILQSERFYGPFKRKMKLKKDYLLDEIKAKYQKGLLFIVIPYEREIDDYTEEGRSVPIQFDHQ